MNKPSGKLAFAYATIANPEEKIARLEAAQPAPVAVVLPEHRVQPNGFTGKGWAELCGWNDCLEEVMRLNGSKP